MSEKELLPMLVNVDWQLTLNSQKPKRFNEAHL